jgi:hypothetical protein
MTSLLDVLKETDLRVDFTQFFPGTGARTGLDRQTLQRRLLSYVSLGWGPMPASSASV